MSYWIFGIPGHPLEISSFLCSQSPERLTVQRVVMDRLPLIHGSVGLDPQNWFLKTIKTTVDGKGEVRHSDDMRAARSNKSANWQVTFVN